MPDTMRVELHHRAPVYSSISIKGGDAGVSFDDCMVWLKITGKYGEVLKLWVSEDPYGYINLLDPNENRLTLVKSGGVTDA